MNKKRALAYIITAILLIAAVFCGYGCEKNGAGGKSGGSTHKGDNGFYYEEFTRRDGFSVNFIDVGEGDAIFINFGDGKTMLIDCGEKSASNFEKIKNYLDAYCGGELDYLLLTHTDTDHIGNGESVVSRVKVKTAFLPDITFTESFKGYAALEKTIKESGAKIVRSAIGCNVLGENYTLLFLSPNAKGTNDSAYDRLNEDFYPSASAINDISPIVYLEYRGVRFVFTGDAGKSQEKIAMNNVDTGLAGRFIKRENAVDLYGIDVLKLSHHGASDGNGAEFLNRLRPKYAVVSAGGDNYYGHPDTETLERVYNANSDCEVLRTADNGTISVCVSESGETTIFLQSE